MPVLIMLLRETTRSEILKLDDVIGTGVGNEKGRSILIVMLRRDNKATRHRIRQVLRGTHYKVVVTGEFGPRRIEKH